MRGITILLIVIFVITLTIMISDCGASGERFDNPSDGKRSERVKSEENYKKDLALQIKNFVNNKTEFADYLTMMQSTNNRSYVLLKPETFNTFKYFATKNPEYWTVDTITKVMTDI